MEKMFEHLDGVKFDNVQFVRRIGKFQKGKDRPVIIGMYSEIWKDQLLHSARELRTSKEFCAVKIRRDLTRFQRQQYGEQIELLKARNASKEGLKEGQVWRLVGQPGDCRLVRGMEADRTK